MQLQHLGHLATREGIQKDATPFALFTVHQLGNFTQFTVTFVKWFVILRITSTSSGNNS